MIETRTVHKANDIRLRRQNHPGPFLVVEGRDDRLFMERYTCTEKCKIVVAQGKRDVCGVIEILDKNDFDGVLGLIDADFDRIEDTQNRGRNILMHEYHDLETMLICSPALDHILVELGSRNKIEDFGASVLEALVSRGLPLGYLRLYSRENALDLKFNGLNYGTWIDPTSFEASTARLITEVKNKSQRPDLSSSQLEDAIRELEGANHDPLEICNGTDLVEILSLGLRRRLGDQNASAVTAEALRRALRLAYSDQNFRTSALGVDIQHWETQALGFQVLRKSP